MALTGNSSLSKRNRSLAALRAFGSHWSLAAAEWADARAASPVNEG
jgi:hypothetical protein